MINVPNNYSLKEVENDWQIAWHGTNYSVLESIAKIGLKPSGGKNAKGEEIEVCCNHISQTVEKYDQKDWGRGIFVSPSIFYSSYEAYAKEICCYNEQYKVLVEVRVKPNSFKKYKSTCPAYKLRIGEPEELQFRIPA